MNRRAAMSTIGTYGSSLAPRGNHSHTVLRRSNFIVDESHEWGHNGAGRRRSDPLVDELLVEGRAPGRAYRG